ncbi:hypothetical protein [Halosolutus gelatinilyticus]|uniref:hypothetical protein n=1 Tax=Halosolutus gelatinilyticus TaxID=2931975 RepID=UPI001FF36C49|nr:hypothetical protein [Halosolutus gelatinilyticus]
MITSAKNGYQLVRELVTKDLYPAIDRLGIETAIRVVTPASVSAAEEAVREALAKGVEVLAEVDIQAINHQYNLDAPEFSSPRFH